MKTHARPASISSMFRKAAADGKITKREAQQIAKAVQKGGVTAKEKTALQANMALHADSFQSATARRPLDKLMGSAPPPPAAAPVGLTADQRKLLADSGVNPGSPEYKSMVAQMLAQNLERSGGAGISPNGYGLTPAQQNVFTQSGLDPNSSEGRALKLQMMVSNARKLGPISPAMLDTIFKASGVDPSSQEGRVMRAQVAMAREISTGAGPSSGYALTAGQQNVLRQSGIDPNSEEGRMMSLQMMMANAQKNGSLSPSVLTQIMRDAGVDPSSGVAAGLRAQVLASASQAQQSAPAGGGGGSNITTSIGQSMGGIFPNGYGLTAAQQKLFEDAGVDPTSPEGKSMQLQMMMANYKNQMELVSNVGKMLTELGSSIIRNIRA